MGIDLIGRLRNLLTSVKQVAGSEFSGIGLLVCDRPEYLPLVPLRERTLPRSTDDLIAVLADIASLKSEFHDGFHVLSTDFVLLEVAQYFSPPAQEGLSIDRTKPIGGRYLAAQFGSAIPGVYMSGIASETLGVAVFKGGAEVLFEAIG